MQTYLLENNVVHWILSYLLSLHVPGRGMQTELFPAMEPGNTNSCTNLGRGLAKGVGAERGFPDVF